MSARTERRKQEPHASGMVTEQEIVRGLRDLGLEAGDLVLAAGFPDLSAIQGGAETVVTALLEAVGPEGTVAMHTGEEVGGWPRPLFNRESSASEQGPVSDAFWRRPGAKRTAAPTGSVAAIGPLAEELTGKHDGDERRDSPWDDRAFSHESPWQQSYDRDARYLLLGGDWNQATLFRLAGVMYLEGMRGKYRPDIPYPTFSQSLMGQKLADEGLVKETKVGPVSLKAVSVRTLVDRVLALLRADPLAFFPVEHEDRFGFTEWYRHIPQMEKRLQAGFAKVKITPETPINHRGVYQDIWARAMVVRDEDTIIALALSDLALIDLPLV
ncbi:MAG: AAC(3) family N-acetyltransferase, partial [Anaerolineae bacterium]|nr:AAC(3) family N-acetyltransferase [Anaerolineae bacterium]